MAVFHIKPKNNIFNVIKIDNIDSSLINDITLRYIRVNIKKNEINFEVISKNPFNLNDFDIIRHYLINIFPDTNIKIKLIKDNNLSVEKIDNNIKQVNIEKNISSSNIVYLSEVEAYEGKNIYVKGMIFHIDIKTLKNSNKYLIMFDITDFHDSISVKLFSNKATFDFKKRDWVIVNGKLGYDKYAGELILTAFEVNKTDSCVRKDTYPEKRVELHLHSKMSAMDGLSNIKDIIDTVKIFGHKAVALTDHGVAHGFPEFYDRALKANIKPIFGVEGYMVDDMVKGFNLKKARRYHINILVKNKEGLKNLYKLISISHLEDFYKKPLMRKTHLIDMRNGLLYGTACEAGELIQAYINGADDEKLLEIAEFYDFIEVMPKSNNMFMVRKNILKSVKDLENMVRKLYEIAKKGKKMCVATGDSHYIHPHDAISREIIQHTQGYEEANLQADLYFRTTDEMIKEFSYLGEDIAKEIVINNPNKLVDEIEEFAPIPDGFYPPKIDGAEEKLVELVYKNAKKYYGDPLPDIVRKRIEKELKPIHENGFAVLYYIAHLIVKKSLEMGYQVGSRGSVGSSLVATMAEITEVNPLPPHYLCENCHYSEFVDDINFECGADLPDKKCPKCGNGYLSKNGFRIPFEIFMGFKGEKVPDIDLNFSGDIQTNIHKYAESIFGKEHSFKAGTISTFQERAALASIEKYLKDNNIVKRKAEIRRLVLECTGVKRTTGQHPGGIIVVPEDKEVFDFCPVQHPADDKSKEVITTHFDYHVMDKQLVKLDLLGHDNPTIIKMLEDLTGIDASQIPLDDSETLKLFKTSKTIGIPEFGTSFNRRVLDVVKVKNFGDIVKVCGLTHGTNVWNNNAEELIREGKDFSKIITMRDDILNYLSSIGVEDTIAFKIMETVRKGKPLSEEQIEIMRKHNVPNWYIESCRKIQYLFPKAHAVAYSMMAFRIAYFKAHYPLEFYATYFTIRPDVFDYFTVLKGQNSIRLRMRQLDNQLDKSARDKSLISILEVALEMCERGFKFLPIKLNESDSKAFEVVKDIGLLCPFASLEGVGEKAALAIVKAREDKKFSSIEDLQIRAKLNKTVISTLKQADILKDLPETEQMTIFF